MSSKSSSFMKFLSSSCFQIYVLCETWLNSEILSTEFFNDNYVVYRCDRSNLNSIKSTGGGVLVAVHKSIKSLETICYHINIECVAVKLIWPRKNLYIYAAYIPPGSSGNVYTLHCENIYSFISNISINDLACVLGDFNLPNIDWRDDDDNFLPFNVKTTEEQILVDTMQALDLSQICRIGNMNSRFLDLVFLSDSSFGVATKSTMPFIHERIHHFGMEINFDCHEIFCKFNNNVVDTKNYNFFKADVPKLQDYFDSVDWMNCLNVASNDITTMTDIFYSKLYEAFEIFVPKTSKRNLNHPPWFNSSLVNLRNRKNKAHKKAKMKDDANLQEIFKQLRREFKHSQNVAYKKYVLNLEENLLTNPKEFWSYVNIKRKCTGYPSSMNLNDSSATNPADICQLFAEFFQSVYKSHDKLNTLPPMKLISNNTIHIPTISVDDVYNGIAEMNHGSGNDNVSTTILKNLASCLSYPLTILFNVSLKTGVFPEIWKKSMIIPIYKTGKRCDVKNYRGISKLSPIPKLFEMIVCNYLYFNVKSLLAHEQHGFIRQRSTTTNLLSLSNIIFNAFETNSQVDVIFTDFSKAFDSPQFEILLDKLHGFGMSPIFLKWIETYLRDRKQVVSMNGTMSKSIDVHSGVPQGSHLGPVLFNMFINEIASTFEFSKCLMYADDLKIIKTTSCPQHCYELQSDLDRLYDWSVANKLHLNIGKCKIMTFYRNKDPYFHNYTIGHHKLERVTSFKDLGVILDSKMTFNDHINATIAKANSMLGFVRRTTKDFTNPLTIKNLYCSLVRSNLEYAAIIWDPAYQIYINRIESVQKRFLLYYFIKIGWPFNKDLPWWQNLIMLPPYFDRCKIAELDTLVKRRKMAETIFMADILNSNIDVPDLLSTINIRVPSKHVRDLQFIYLKTFKNNYSQHAPFPSLCRQFNENFKMFDFNLSKFIFKKIIKNEL